MQVNLNLTSESLQQPYNMRMRWSFSIFFLTAFLCFHQVSFSQDINFNLVARSPEDVDKVLGMAQDAQGFLWLATANGLYKYDGYHYTAYHSQPRNHNSPASDYIECIAIDKEGNIWLGPQGVGLDRFDPVTGVFTHFRHNYNDSRS